MTMKVFQLFFCIFLIKLAFPVASHARPSKPKVESTTSIDIKNLEGYKKGQMVKGLEQVRTYLSAYGYLNYTPDQTHANNDNFDDALEAAIKLYQFNYHLNTTGTLDAQTVSKMMVPRCSFPDIINGTNLMRPSKVMANKTHDTLRNVSHFAYLDGSPRWPVDKYSLTYGFFLGVPKLAEPTLKRALDNWADESVFSFKRVRNALIADVKIGFYHGDHGDGAPFTSPTQLAHSFGPPSGRLHFNAATKWSEGLFPDTYDLGTVALHELGHILGLGHSEERSAVMWPSIPKETIKGLTADDIAGIQTLYNF